MSAPSNSDWPEGLTEDGDKLFLHHELSILKNPLEDLIHHWHNAQFTYPRRDKWQKHRESRFLFPPSCYAVLNWYCKACAIYRATKHPNWSTAGNRVYTINPDSPIRWISMDVFGMLDVSLEGEVFDLAIFAVHHDSRYIVAVLGKIFQEEGQEGQAQSGAAS